MTVLRVLIAASLAAALAAPDGVRAQPADIVIVVDNSGSMRANDPQGLTRQAVRELVSRVGVDDRVALVAFDERPRLELPLTAAHAARLDASLVQLDFRGRWTDLPAAVERALYHLQEQGRGDAAQVVLVFTDGIVDTGNAARDRDREAWLLGELAATARERGVRVFGIAFSDDADFRVIQALAGATGADYRRVLDAAQLAGAFTALQAQFVLPVVPEPAVEAPAAERADPATVEPAPPVAAAPERGSRLALVAALVAVFAGAGVAIFVAFRARSHPRAPTPPPGAVLVDRAGISGKPRLALPLATAVIGRRPAPDPVNVTSIVLDKETISRRHATIAWRDGEYWLDDHGSANGTTVDDIEVIGSVVLHDGARIRFDEFEFEFRLVPNDRTLVRDDEQGGDATVMRPTTIFRVPPELGSDPTGPKN